MALTRNRRIQSSFPDKKGQPASYEAVAPNEFFKGSLVSGTSAGKVKPRAALTEVFAGVVTDYIKVESGETKLVPVEVNSTIWYTVDSGLAVLANMWKLVQAADDETFALHTGNNKVLGKIVGVDTVNNKIQVDHQDRSTS